MAVGSSTSDTGRSFGGYLRRQRHVRGMTLGEVARRIHVRSQMLRLIEADDHIRLPDPLFVRSFIRAYARAVDADAEHAVDLFETSLDGHLAAQQVDAAMDRYETGFGRRLAAVEIAVLQWADTAGSRGPSAAAATAVNPSGGAMAPSGTPDDPELAASHRLEILARETTWLRISLDGHPPREYRLLAGDRLELDAHRQMELLIGNARGVTLTLNRSPVPVVGQSGQVVRLRLP